MGARGALIDIVQMGTMLLVAPFHRWLGLDIAALSGEELIVEMLGAMRSSPTR